MEYHLHTHGFKASTSIKNYVDRKILALIEKFLTGDSVVVYARVSDENGPKGGMDKKFSVDIRFPKKHRIHLTETCDHVYEAIDVVAKELEVILKKNKDKFKVRNPLRRRGAARKRRIKELGYPVDPIVEPS